MVDSENHYCDMRLGDSKDKTKKIKGLATFIRLTLTVILLVFVWMNAHWSVSLILTLIATNLELQEIAKNDKNELKKIN